MIVITVFTVFSCTKW